MSIYQNYLALRRHFRQQEVALAPSSEVRNVLRGLIERFKRREGIEHLRAKQAEPITPRMVRQMLRTAEQASRAGGTTWNLREHRCFITMAWAVVNLSCGTRKAESVRLPGDLDENDWFTMLSLSWNIGGRTIKEPTLEQLNSLTTRDYAMLAPKGSKCDTWGTAHGTEPIVLPFRQDELNAALWLRRVEIRRMGCDRRYTALFGDAHGQPYTSSAFDDMVRGAIRRDFGEAAAKIYTPHSWRVWVSTALRARNASDRIQLMMLRWLNPDSIKIYARATVSEKVFWVDELAKVSSVDAARTTTHDALAGSGTMIAWGSDLGDRQESTVRRGEDAFDARVAACAAAPQRPDILNGARLQVYWTEMDAWYTATHLSTRKLCAADGHAFESHLLYDAVDAWPAMKYWHRLDDEQWEKL